METINHTRLQRQTKQVLDEVSINKQTLIVHRAKTEDVVMMPISEWNSIQETLYLNSTEANRKWLEESFKEAEQGKVTTIDPDNLWK